MLVKCSMLGYEGCAELVALPSDVWSLRPAVAPAALTPAVKSICASHGIHSLRYGPPAVIAVVGQLHPLVHGRAWLPRQPPPPLGGGSGSISNGGDDANLLQSLLQQRWRSHALASTSASTVSGAATGPWDPSPVPEAASAAGLDAGQHWLRPSRNALLRLDEQMTAARAAVCLLRIAHESHPLIEVVPPAGKCSPDGTDPPSPGEEAIQRLTAAKGARGAVRADRGAGSPKVERGVAKPAREQTHDERCLGSRPPTGVVSDLEQFLASGPPSQQQQMQLLPRPATQQPKPQQQQQTQQPSQPPLKLLAGLDHLALCESLEVLQPLLHRLSVTQLQRCLETLAAVRHTPTDPWFHDWLLASEAQLQRADATEVYGMMVAMRVLRLRPQSAAWVDGAVGALSTNLPQLDAVQVVELLGCFADMALRLPAGLLSRAFALLVPDLAQLQPRVVLDFLSSCSRLRVTPPMHVMASAYGALTPAAVAAAPPAQLCRLAAAAATLRVQPPLGLLTALVGRADALLRSTVAAAAPGEGGGAAFRGNGTAAPAELPHGAAGATERTARGPLDAINGSRTLQPHRGKARRVAAAATVAAGHGSSSSGPSPLSPTPPDPPSLTAQQLSCLLRDLRLLQAPLPPDWGDLCGGFLVAATDLSTPIVQVSYLLRAVARCGLSLPSTVVRVVAARLEASLRSASEQRRRLRRRGPQHPQQRPRARPQRGGDTDTDGMEAVTEEEDAVGQANGDGGGDMGAAGSGEESICFTLDSAPSQWTPPALSITTTALVPYAAHLHPSLLRALYDNLYDNLERFDLPELTATLHALPLLSAPPRRLVRYRHVGAVPAAAALPPPPAALITSYLSCLRGRMHRMQPWQISMCIFSLLRLRARPDPGWMDAFLGQVYGKLSHMNEVQVASVAWVVARMSYRPAAGWVERLLAAAAGRLSCYSPRHLCQLLWAVGAMGYRPGGAWMARWLDKARAHFRTSDGRTLAALAWAVAALGHRPEAEWLQDLCAHLARRLPYTSPRAVANTMAALAALGHRPPASWLETVEGHVRARLAAPPPSGAAGPAGVPAAATAAEGGCYSLQDLAHVCHSLARLRYSPADGWVDAVATAAGRLALLDPGAAMAPGGSGAAAGYEMSDADAEAAAAAAAHAKHIALLMLALARLRRRPPRAAWAALLEGLYPCLPYAAPQALAVLLAAAAVLRLRLPREHAGALLLATHRRLGDFSGRGLAMVFRGFVEVGVDPGSRWLGRLEEVLMQRREEEEEEEEQQRRRQRQRGGSTEMGHGSEEEGEEQCRREEDEEEGDQQEEAEGQGQQQGRRWPWGQQMSPRERNSMLWAAVTLETARLEDPAAVSDPFATRRKHRHMQQQLQLPGAVGAGGHPPPPRWLRKQGPLRLPLRLAGLIALLLPAPDSLNAKHEYEGDGGRAQGDGERVAGHGSGDDVGRCSGSDGGYARRRQGWGGPLVSYSGRDLALVCWALGRLRMRPRGLVSALLSEVRDRLTTAGSSGAAAAELQARGAPAASGAAAVTAVESVAGLAAPAEAAPAGAGGAFASREMAMMYWGLSSVGVWPSAAWQAAAAAAALRAARRGELSPHDLATVLAALARWRREPRVRQNLRRPRPLWRRLRLEGREAPLRLLPGQGCAAEVRLRACTAALAKLALADSAAYMPAAAGGNVTTVAAAAAAPGAEHRARCYDARSLATLTWALASLGVVRRLPDPWVAAFMPVSLRLLSHLPPSHRVTMLDSLSRMGLRPGPAWMDKAEQVVMSGGLALASSYRGLEAALRRMSISEADSTGSSTISVTSPSSRA